MKKSKELPNPLDYKKNEFGKYKKKMEEKTGKKYWSINERD